MESNKPSNIADAGVGIDSGSHSLKLGFRAVTTSFSIGAVATSLVLAPAFLMMTSSAERQLWLARQFARVGVDLFGLVDPSASINGQTVRLATWIADRANWEQAVHMIDWVGSALLILFTPWLVGAIAIGYVIHACASFLGRHYKTDQVLQGVGGLITDVDAFNEESRRLRRGVEVKPTRFGKALTDLLS